MTGEAGQRIDIRYLCESPNGSNSYTMRGGAPESYHTRFTWYVFREVEIDGWPGELSPGQITAEAVYTDVSLSLIHILFFRAQVRKKYPPPGAS